VVLWALAALPALVRAQEPEATQSRAAAVEEAQAAKAAAAHPYQPNAVEVLIDRFETHFVEGPLTLHPFFNSAYSGGGFTLGAGYALHPSAYSILDLRGSITFSGYKRIEAAYMAPRLFSRRGTFTATGGWREATAVGFYGIGTENTSKDDRANYSFDQPYGSAYLDFWPTRKLLFLRGGVEISQWRQGPGGADDPSVEEVYTPETLPGLGAKPTYIHSEGTLAIDSRPAPGYARTGGFYGVTVHDFHDTDGAFGFREVDYDAIQHIPLLRDTWVLSLHARVETAASTDGQEIPFFMLPALGGGSSLRGFASWRFRDLNSLLLQADWRVLANRFMDMAVVYDAGRVASRVSDLTNTPLKSDYGLGFRFHGPITTPLRIEFVHSNEGFRIVFASKAAF
jgi:hypothetical protein